MQERINISNLQTLLTQGVLAPQFQPATVLAPTLTTVVPSQVLPQLAATAQAAQPAQVLPGDLITSDLFNNLLQRLTAVENKTADVRLLLGPLGVDAHTFVAIGTGFQSAGGIFVDGQPLLQGDPTRGINLAIVDANLGFKFRGSYDTYAYPAASNQLTSDIQANTQPNDIVVAVTHDAYASSLQANARAALASVGGLALSQVTGLRDNAAFIGTVPANRTTASFSFLNSVMPIDGPAQSYANLVAALPFVWGVYSRPLQRFVMGGGSAVSPSPSAVTAAPSGGATGTTTFTPGILTTLANAATRVTGRVNPGDPITSLPGVGQAEQETLAKANVTTVGDLVSGNPATLATTFGVSQDQITALQSQVRAALPQ